MTTTEASWPDQSQPQEPTQSATSRNRCVRGLPSAMIPLDIPAGDPFLDYLQNASGAVDIERVTL